MKEAVAAYEAKNLEKLLHLELTWIATDKEADQWKQGWNT